MVSKISQLLTMTFFRILSQFFSLMSFRSFQQFQCFVSKFLRHPQMPPNCSGRCCHRCWGCRCGKCHEWGSDTDVQSRMAGECWLAGVRSGMMENTPSVTKSIHVCFHVYLRVKCWILSGFSLLASIRWTLRTFTMTFPFLLHIPTKCIFIFQCNVTKPVRFHVRCLSRQVSNHVLVLYLFPLIHPVIPPPHL